MTSFEKHVLVTGGSGFIGSNLLECFTGKYPNYFFICIDKLNYASIDMRRLQKLNFKLIELDIVDYKKLTEVLDEYPISDIINLAAESCVDRSFKDPLYFTTNNILSTQNLLEYIRLHQNIRFVHISTDEVYGEQTLEDQRVKETDILNPSNPYSATKAAIDLIIKSYEQSYGLKSSIIRSNNVYGPNQYPEKIIPMTIHSLKTNKKITVHGDGHHKRSYLYVTDLISAIDLIWHTNSYGIYNVGSPYEITNIDLVKLIVRLFKKDSNSSEYIVHVKDRNYNDIRYLIDYSKMLELGWCPKVDLETGLNRLVNL